MPLRVEPLDTKNPLEPEVYLDTSLIILLIGRSAGFPDIGRRKATLARFFFERCAKEEIALVISGWSLIELRNAIFSGMYRTIANKEGLASPKLAYTSHPEYMETVWNEITRVETLLQQIPNSVIIETPIDEDMLRRSLGFVYQLGLEPADALHYAIGSLNKIGAYASADDMWERFPDGVLYTCSDKILYARGQEK